MPRATSPDPLLRTPDDQLNKVEQFKAGSNRIVGALPEETRDLSFDEIGEASEQLAKSHGIYLEYNRATTGREKDWMYMVRLTVPGGGAFNRDQWRIVDDLADKYCTHNPHGGVSIRLTTRQNLQYHWLKKADLVKLVQEIAATGFYTLNGCGDNVRNVMGCPMSKFTDVPGANAFAMAHEYGAYFRLPAAPHIQVFAVDPNHIHDPTQQYAYGQRLLNRKFKIGFSTVQRDADGRLVGDNCVELRTNDLGISPVLNAAGDAVERYCVWVGGGQGEKNGKPTAAVMGQALGLFAPDDLMHGLKSVVDVHSDWGDRKNRHWARLKYVVLKQGIGWYRDEMRQLGASFELPRGDEDPGRRELHHGWMTTPGGDAAGKLAFGAYIEAGRLVDTNEGDDPDRQSGNVTGNGRLKSMVRDTLEAFEGVEALITPNQDLVFTHIDTAAKEDFAAKLASYGFGTRKGQAYSTLRRNSGACVGLPTCRLSYTDSEQFEPELLDELDAMGYGDVNESIGITGCERQCFRAATKTIGWVGQGPNMYGLKLGGSEDGRHQGHWLVDGDGKWWLRQTPRELVAPMTAALFDYAKAQREADEDAGATLRRVGVQAILDHLRADTRFEPAFKKALPGPYLPLPVLSGTPASA